ncbi:MAG: hypothetical protein QM764_10605 [Chitinophagaceae bacterium]
MLFKKRNKLIHEFWTGTSIAFQTADKEWQQGEIKRIKKDSVYIRPYAIHYYLMYADTVRMPEKGYSFSDIYAMPKRGVIIHYANGHNEINMDSGHKHFYWIKSGWIFRIGAAGYAALHVINGLIKNNLSLSESIKPIGIAAGVFAGGFILKKTYKLTNPIGKKYHFVTLQFAMVR